MKRCSYITIVIALVAAMMSFTTQLAAQSDSAAVRAIYEASATVRSNIEGIRTFPEPPAGFNALTASDEERASYGIPPRPDKAQDPDGYAKWARAMATPAKRWNGELRRTPYYSQPAKHALTPSGAGISAVPTVGYFYNWSGFINTNTLTKYGPHSFYYIISDFNVPAVNQAPSTCDGGWDLEVSWNGIDGDKDGSALLQGGSYSGAYCSAGTYAWDYLAWIEWFPAYPIIGEYNVNPGDDMFVETWDTSSTNGYVALYDETLGVYAVYNITSNGGPGLVGNSAEYVVERPCCRNFGSFNSYFPLPNYVWDFWANSYAQDFYNYDHSLASTWYPGSTSTSTVLANMVNDQDSEVISAPAAQGKYGIFFEAEGCANGSGGCTP